MMANDMKENNENINEWSFPTVDGERLSKQTGINQEVTDTENVQTELSPEQKVQNELETLKQEYEKKCHVLAEILTKLNTPIAVIDEELLLIIQDIIKKSVKKLILKEMEVDKEIIQHLVDRLKELIPAEQTLLSIELSPDDYAYLQASETFKDAPIVANSELTRGDVIIKSKFSEVRAIINERIDQLIRIQHE